MSARTSTAPALRSATEAIKRFGLKAGDKAMVWGLLSQPTRGERTKGVKEALEKAGLKVDYIEIDAATNKDPAAGTPTFVGYVSANPDVKLVVTDHGGLTATAETYLKAAGKKAGRDQHRRLRPLAGDRRRPSRAAGPSWSSISSRGCRATCPILQLCLTKTYGFSGLHIDTGGGFVDKDNIDFLAPLAEKEIR